MMIDLFVGAGLVTVFASGWLAHRFKTNLCNLWNRTETKIGQKIDGSLK